jgi:hypothetical protein
MVARRQPLGEIGVNAPVTTLDRTGPLKPQW